MVSAWAADNREVLGQVATEAKYNEITAIPHLLELLVLKGCIVTIDAMGCQPKIAEQIIAAGGAFVVALKGNQGALADDVEEAFIGADAKDYTGSDSQVVESSERNHGRAETRRCRTLGNLDGVPCSALWKGLNMIGMVESPRELDGKRSTEYRFYIGSIGADAARFARAVRGHWGFENDLHWSLDVAFRADESRLRAPPSARELYRASPYCSDTNGERQARGDGIKNKRLKAGWDDDCLAQLLFEIG